MIFNFVDIFIIETSVNDKEHDLDDGEQPKKKKQKKKHHHHRERKSSSSSDDIERPKVNNKPRPKKGMQYYPFNSIIVHYH